MSSGSTLRNSGVLAPLGFGIAYFVVMLIGRRHIDPELGIATVWPAAGVAVGVVASTTAARRGRMVGAMFVANVAGNVLTGSSGASAFGFAVANTVGVVLAASLLGDDHVSAVEGIRRMTPLLGAVVVGGAGAAALGVAMLALGGPIAHPGRVLVSWAVSDAVGMLIFAPLVVSLRYVDPFPGWRLALRRVGTAALVAGFAIFMAIYAGRTDRPAMYLVVAAFMLAAVVVGGRMLIVTLAATFVAMSELNHAGIGTFVGDRTYSDVLTLQAFAAVVSTCSMMVASIHRRSAILADQLFQTLNAAHSAVLVVGHDGCVAFANPAAERTFGPVRGRSVIGVFGAHTAAKLLAAEGAHDAVVDTVDGPVPMDITVGAFADTAGTSTVLVARDLSARFAAERQIRRLSEVVEASPNFIGFADHEGKLQYLSPGARRMLDIGERPVEGARIDAFAPEWAASLLREVAIPSAVVDGVWSGQSALRRADGTEVPVTQIVMAHRDEHGELDMVSTIAHDISDRVRMERERSELITNLVHDLRNPLVAISGAAEMLVEDARSGRGLEAELVEIVDAGAAQLRRLADDLIAGRELDEMPAPTREVVNLYGLASRVVSLHVLPAARSSVSLVVTGEPAHVEGDRTALHRMVENLVTNAIKYSPMGGSVRVAVAVEETEAVIRVIDEGIGIDASDLPAMFERYRRAATATSAGIGGTGIGLAICRQIAEGHGGTIGVQSRPGIGSVFEVRLPRVGDHQPAGIS